MPRCVSPLLLAMSLGVFPASGAAQVKAPVHDQPKAQVPSAPAPVKATAPTRKRTADAASAKPSPAGKVRKGTSAKGNPAAVKASKADCDTPEPPAALPKPVPVAADPLTPTLMPCAEPARKP